MSLIGSSFGYMVTEAEVLAGWEKLKREPVHNNMAREAQRSFGAYCGILKALGYRLEW